MASKWSSFLAELGRRKVTRVAMIYAAVGAALAGAAKDHLPRLQLPEWTVTFVVVPALLGFPIAILLAWLFDLTPEGIRRATEPTSVEAASDWQSVPQGLKIAATAGVLVAVAVAVALTVWLSGSPGADLDPNRVVVFPLDIPDEPGSTLPAVAPLCALRAGLGASGAENLRGIRLSRQVSRTTEP